MNNNIRPWNFLGTNKNSSLNNTNFLYFRKIVEIPKIALQHGI